MLNFGERRVADELFGDGPIPDAVIERSQLELADPVAIDTGRRFAGKRRRGRCGICTRGKRSPGCAVEHVASCHDRHEGGLRLRPLLRLRCRAKTLAVAPTHSVSAKKSRISV